MASLTHETFAELVNTKFRVNREGSDSPVELELIQVGEFLQTPHQERFSILFRGPADPFLAQSIYSFNHEGMEQFDLFIVPIGRKDTGYEYEAVFNRLRK